MRKRIKPCYNGYKAVLRPSPGCAGKRAVFVLKSPVKGSPIPLTPIKLEEMRRQTADCLPTFAESVNEMAESIKQTVECFKQIEKGVNALRECVKG